MVGKRFPGEISGEPSVVMTGKNKAEEILPDAIENHINMKDIPSSRLNLPEYHEGFIVPHEEIVSLSQKCHVPIKFIYALNIQTMGKLIDALLTIPRLTSSSSAQLSSLWFCKEHLQRTPWASFRNSTSRNGTTVDRTP